MLVRKVVEQGRGGFVECLEPSLERFLTKAGEAFRTDDEEGGRAGGAYRTIVGPTGERFARLVIPSRHLGRRALELGIVHPSGWQVHPSCCNQEPRVSTRSSAGTRGGGGGGARKIMGEKHSPDMRFMITASGTAR